MDSISLPRGVRALRSTANALGGVTALASLGVIAFMLFGSHGGSDMVALASMTSVFTFALGAMLWSFWSVFTDDSASLCGLLYAPMLALSVTATALVSSQGGFQGWIYGPFLLLPALLATGLYFRADLREHRRVSEIKAEADAAWTLEIAGAIEQPAVTADSDLRVRLENALPLLKHTS